MKTQTTPELLSSWKEIANYLGKGVRTIQRYETQFGLPVRRPAGKSRSAVIATRLELDAWVAASPMQSEYRLSRVEASLQMTKEIASLRESLRATHKQREEMQALRFEMRERTAALHNAVERLRKEISSADVFSLDGPVNRDRKPQ